jgi:hypothetical protein
VTAVADAIGVSRSQLHSRLAAGCTEPRRRYRKADDAMVVPLITVLVAARPTHLQLSPHYRSLEPPTPGGWGRAC